MNNILFCHLITNHFLLLSLQIKYYLSTLPLIYEDFFSRQLTYLTCTYLFIGKKY